MLSHDECQSIQISSLLPTIRSCLLDIIPPGVWIECILPLLDRPSWNALQESSRGIYRLVHSKAIAPPWPERCFAAQGSNSIESFTISADGEYLAYGSMIGSIEVWSRCHGKLSLLAKDATRSGTHRNVLSSRASGGFATLNKFDLGESSSSSTGSHVRRYSPVGSCLKFAPVGSTLACGFENRIFLWQISDPRLYHHPQQHRQQDKNQYHGSNAVHASPPLKVLEIECHKGTMYEVTYIGFSADATRFVARYGKMAYIWNLTYPDNGNGSSTLSVRSPSLSSALPEFHLACRIPLNSSRCHMASSPCLFRLAVTNASSSEDRGVIDVWNLRPQYMQHYGDQNNNESPLLSLCPESSTCRIPAYGNEQVIRGLDFVFSNGYGGESLVGQSDGNFKNRHWLVSASLQGEIKFWSYQESTQAKKLNVGGGLGWYTCIYAFQCPGKIFSMALSTRSITTGSDRCAYLAVGQARGQIRVWKFPRLDATNNNGQQKGRSTVGDEIITTASPQKDGNTNSSMDEYLAADIGEHTHHDNIKLISFTPDGKSLVASRAYDARIWFRTFQP